jgi:hypothetical protein
MKALDNAEYLAGGHYMVTLTGSELIEIRKALAALASSRIAGQEKKENHDV